MKYLILFCILAGISCAQQVNNSLRSLRQAQRQAYHPPPQAPANYRPLNQAPGNIQQLLQLQQYREPIVHLPPQPPPNLARAGPAQPQLTNQAQVSQYKPNVQYGQAPEQPTYRNQAAAIAAQYRPQGQQQQQYNPQHAPQQYQG